MNANNKKNGQIEMELQELDHAAMEQINGGLSLKLGGPLSLVSGLVLPLGLGALSLGTNLDIDLTV